MIRRLICGLLAFAIGASACAAMSPAGRTLSGPLRFTPQCILVAPTGVFSSPGLTASSSLVGSTLTTAAYPNPLCSGSTATGAKLVEGAGTTNLVQFTYTGAIAASNALHSWTVIALPFNGSVIGNAKSYPRNVKLALLINPSLGGLNQIFDVNRCTLAGNYVTAPAPQTTGKWLATPVIWNGQQGCQLTISSLLSGSTAGTSATLQIEFAIGQNSAYTGSASTGAGVYLWGAAFN